MAATALCAAASSALISVLPCPAPLQWVAGVAADGRPLNVFTGINDQHLVVLITVQRFWVRTPPPSLPLHAVPPATLACTDAQY